ncbi:hypothetical protein STEG23_036097, partial [Scotinomys teguina]
NDVQYSPFSDAGQHHQSHHHKEKSQYSVLSYRTYDFAEEEEVQSFGYKRFDLEQQGVPLACSPQLSTLLFVGRGNALFGALQMTSFIHKTASVAIGFPLSANECVHLSRFKDFDQLNSNNGNQLDTQTHTLLSQQKKTKTKQTKSPILQELSKYSEETMHRVIYMYTCKYFPYFEKFVNNQDCM